MSSLQIKNSIETVHSIREITHDGTCIYIKNAQLHTI